jgi:hypothetical protein
MLTSPDVSVWGMDAPQSQRFHSSRIVERVDKTTLKTKSGSIYILVYVELDVRSLACIREHWF